MDLGGRSHLVCGGGGIGICIVFALCAVGLRSRRRRHSCLGLGEVGEIAEKLMDGEPRLGSTCVCVGGGRVESQVASRASTRGRSVNGRKIDQEPRRDPAGDDGVKEALRVATDMTPDTAIK